MKIRWVMERSWSCILRDRIRFATEQGRKGQFLSPFSMMNLDQEFSFRARACLLDSRSSRAPDKTISTPAAVMA